ncbi:MAG: hypothetical protein NVV63_13695 [Opitutus sp.]|nr:hypothetical protein [Opitutus sp.]
MFVEEALRGLGGVTRDILASEIRIPVIRFIGRPQTLPVHQRKILRMGLRQRRRKDPLHRVREVKRRRKFVRPCPFASVVLDDPEMPRAIRRRSRRRRRRARFASQLARQKRARHFRLRRGRAEPRDAETQAKPCPMKSQP